MDRRAVAARTAKPIGDLPAIFMLESATYEHGASLGFPGFDFYVSGRGGVLGDVDADVVSAGFVFFNPSGIRASWERGRDVMPRADAAEAFAGCLYRWSQEHLPASVDYARLAELAGRVVVGANPAGAPIFAGWRALTQPDEPTAKALHQVNALRELRGALHGAAVLAAGLEPLQAVMVKTPSMAGIFGWKKPLPDPDAFRGRWQEAEAATDGALALPLAVLDDHEADELADLLEQTLAGLHRTEEVSP
jgi:hypothetical protein